MNLVKWHSDIAINAQKKIVISSLANLEGVVLVSKQLKKVDHQPSLFTMSVWQHNTTSLSLKQILLMIIFIPPYF